MRSIRPARTLARGAWLLLLAASAGCAEEPYPWNDPRERRVSEEVYRVMCKRLAKEAAPQDFDGTLADNLCWGEGDPYGVMAQPAALRLRSLNDRRPKLLPALDQVFGDAPTQSSEGFADGDITRFLADIVPYYDAPGEVIPKASDAIAAVLTKLIDPLTPEGAAKDGSKDAQRAEAVLKKLQSVAARKGYRPANRQVGTIRPILAYPGLDDVAQQLLGFVGEGGAGHDAMVALLKAGALELAEEAAASDPKDPERLNTTLHTVLDLLLSEDETLGEAGQGPNWVLRRDAQGNALVKAKANTAALPTPFPVPGTSDTRAGFEPAKEAYEFFDASKTALAGAMRETKAIVERSAPDKPSTLDNFMRGLRPLMGPTVQRSYDFAGKPYAFQGPDLSQGAVLDLIHALGVLASYPETADVVELVMTLLKEHETAAMGPVFAGLNIDARADKYPDAKLVGYDGTDKTPSEFWDDAIGVGQRMLKRKGMLEALISSFADPAGASQGKLYGTWMRFKDDAPYVGAPITPNGPGPAGFGGAYSPEQKTQMNTPIAFQYKVPVDRAQPDIDMNRSIWQRTMSLINALNGKKVCNIKDGTLTVGTAVLIPFTFPYGGLAGYQECENIEIQDAVEIYGRAVIGKARIVVKDISAAGLGTAASPVGLVAGVPPGSMFGKILEVYTDIDGLTDTPNAVAMARFIYAPRNKFLTGLMGKSQLSVENVDMSVYEPNAMFHLENKQAVAGNQSFVTVGVPLVKALDDTELRTGDLDPKLSDGYMFGHMLSVFHKHWSSRKSTPCPAMATKGQAGCTQSLDPKNPFYSPQSNLVSYEQLLAEALVDEDLTGVLQKSADEVKKVTINGKNGLQVLAAFAEKILTPDPKLTYRNGRKFSATNSCAFPANAVEAPKSCDCPAGSTPGTPETCVAANGSKFPRGRIMQGGVAPIYLVLDALKKMDQGFSGANQDRLDPWHAARSNLVDQFLSTDAVGGKYRMRNQRARFMGIKIMRWMLDRIAAHKKDGDLEKWALGLDDRFEKTFNHPLAAAGLDLLDKFWESQGAAQQWAAISAFIMDPQRNPEDFANFLVALADGITLVDREPDVTPLVQFASLVAAPNAFQALDNGTTPDVENGAFYRGLEVSRNAMSVDKAPTPSALSKVLKNAVLPNAQGESPLEALIDVIAEVNRNDPLLPGNQLLTPSDYRKVFEYAKSFMTDPDHGLRRLYTVIQHRKVKN